jgi:ribosome-binding protein aMBF1 (putative translation factor)
MTCDCGKEIADGEIFNLIINGKIVNVCGDCWWNSLKPKGENNVHTS